MAEALTFSHCLNQLMQKHELSANRLSAFLGCTRSEIKQLLASEGTAEKRSQIFKKITNCNLFLPEELWELEQALQVSRIGLERYRFQNAIEEILSGKSTLGSAQMMSDNNTSISSVLEVYQEAEQIDILCLNSCFPKIIHTIRPLFDKQDRRIRMWHLISTADVAQRSASLVSCILPLVFDPRYHPYRITPPSSDVLCPIGGNLLAIRGSINGEWKETFLSVINETLFYELPNAESCGMFAYTCKLFKAIRNSLRPLKETEHPQEDFTSLCMTFLSHELNRATYNLANGLCFHQVPTHIAIAALNDADFFTKEEVSELIRRTFSIHEQRFQNFYHKRKPTYMIMTQAGCQQFLDTGVNPDHFVGFRPFTPAERKEIFLCMLETAEDNPYYFPLLMKDSHFTYRYNLECSDKLGVSFDATDTNYNLRNGYRPVFLMFPEFTKQYLSYYLETLVKEKCHSRENSLRLLMEMYEAFLQKFHLKTH